MYVQKKLMKSPYVDGSSEGVNNRCTPLGSRRIARFYIWNTE